MEVEEAPHYVVEEDKHVWASTTIMLLVPPVFTPYTPLFILDLVLYLTHCITILIVRTAY